MISPKKKREADNSSIAQLARAVKKVFIYLDDQQKSIVDTYISRTLYEIGWLEKELEMEQKKNDNVKPMLHTCALRLLELDPSSDLAQKALVLLLEEKMK